MKAPLRPRRFGIDVNLTPLIDVVFNLVIFFLVVSHFARSEALEELQLPEATQAVDQEESPRRLLITVRPDGSYSVGGREVDLPEIELMIREGAKEDPASLSVQIRGDRLTPFGKVEQLMELCPPHGVTNVAFRVLQAAE